MHLVVNIVVISLFLALLWLLVMLYVLWKKMPNIVQYVLFFPCSILLTLILTYALMLTFFRDEILSGNIHSFFMADIVPLFGAATTVSVFSFLIVFLVPEREKTILRIMLAVFMCIGSIVWLGRIIMPFIYNNLSFWKYFSLLDIAWSVVAMATCVAWWKKADYIVEVKQKL